MNEKAIISISPVTHKEHRRHFGKCDPEHQVVEEVSNTNSVLPLLTNFPLDNYYIPTWNTQFFRYLEQPAIEKGFTRFICHSIDNCAAIEEITRPLSICIPPEKSINFNGKKLLSSLNLFALLKTSAHAILLE